MREEDKKYKVYKVKTDDQNGGNTLREEKYCQDDQVKET
tara:strand:+ start:762 stop:878 length:117 start_codon:yes stop_codon:yes gene_type:complete